MKELKQTLLTTHHTEAPVNEAVRELQCVCDTLTLNPPIRPHPEDSETLITEIGEGSGIPISTDDGAASRSGL
jgi:hypothetical protein